MTGRRLYPDENGDIPFSLIVPGTYFRDGRGRWGARVPSGLLAGLNNHAISEHADGTITVAPSILVTNGEGGESWHGYLTDGVFRSC